uniref:Clathrin light chain n=1 Tax=Chelonoidis abingdonii TaxID=106734 RepID=A0A8C0QLB0_CHEAB
MTGTQSKTELVGTENRTPQPGPFWGGGVSQTPTSALTSFPQPAPNGNPPSSPSSSGLCLVPGPGGHLISLFTFSYCAMLMEGLGAGRCAGEGCFSWGSACPPQESNGPTDGYAAIARADRLTQEPESIRKWREEQKKRLQELDAASKVMEQEWREKAKKDLEEWNVRQSEQMEKNRVNNSQVGLEISNLRDTRCPDRGSQGSLASMGRGAPS